MNFKEIYNFIVETNCKFYKNAYTINAMIALDVLLCFLVLADLAYNGITTSGVLFNIFMLFVINVRLDVKNKLIEDNK